MKHIATDVTDSREQMRSAIAGHRDGYAMDNYFYRSHLVYQRELEQIFFNSWLYAGHVSQIPSAHDFFIYEVGEDSVIVSRGGDGQIRASHNICRHRGARVCEQLSGNQRLFVCPYHAWSYNSAGQLVAARHMDMCEGFRKEDYGLKQLSVATFHGLIFIHFDPEALAFEPHLARLQPTLGPYQLEQAQLLDAKTFKIDANWKFVQENYVECYHCGPSHQEYAKRHTLQDVFKNVKHMDEAMLARAAQATGVPGVVSLIDEAFDQAQQFGYDVYAQRYGLYESFLTGSQDGQPVAPLMGDFKGYDGGAGDFQIGPCMFMLNYPDHCVLYRFTPRSLTQTDMLVAWFVNGDARPGKDFDEQAVSWLWTHTSHEDEYIILRNSEGANSRHFQPGPLHPEFESLQRRFIRWYLGALSD